MAAFKVSVALFNKCAITHEQVDSSNKVNNSFLTHVFFFLLNITIMNIECVLGWCLQHSNSIGINTNF